MVNAFITTLLKPQTIVQVKFIIIYGYKGFTSFLYISKLKQKFYKSSLTRCSHVHLKKSSYIPFDPMPVDCIVTVHNTSKPQQKPQELFQFAICENVRPLKITA